MGLVYSLCPLLSSIFCKLAEKSFILGPVALFGRMWYNGAISAKGGDSFAAVQAFGSMQGLIRTGRHGA